MAFQSYQSYGIERAWVDRLKKKAKDPLRKNRLRELSEGLTKEDLQDPDKVAGLLSQAMKVLGEKPGGLQAELAVRYVIDQKIDPQNMLHLIKLWSMFR